MFLNEVGQKEQPLTNLVGAIITLVLNVNEYVTEKRRELGYYKPDRPDGDRGGEGGEGGVQT